MDRRSWRASLEICVEENTFLHYAAGYGHLEVLKEPHEDGLAKCQELLEASEKAWPENAWNDIRNGRAPEDLFECCFILPHFARWAFEVRDRLHWTPRG